MEECVELIEIPNRTKKKLKKMKNQNSNPMRPKKPKRIDNSKPFFASFPSDDAVQISDRVILYRTYSKFCAAANTAKMSDVKEIIVTGVEKLEGIEQRAFQKSIASSAILTSELEAKVVRTILDRLKQNNPMTTQEFKDLVVEMNSQKLSHQSKLNNTTPSKPWLTLFRNRYRPIFYDRSMTIRVEFNKDLSEYGKTKTSQPTHEADGQVIRRKRVKKPTMVEVVSTPDMKPTQPYEMMICRFCMEITDENHRKIPSRFYNEFEKFTGVQLDQNSKYPKILCENCHEKFSNFLEFLQLILSTQTKLQKMFDGSNLTLSLQDYRQQDNSEFQLFQEIGQMEEIIIKQEPQEIQEVFLHENVFAENFNDFENNLEIFNYKDEEDEDDEKIDTKINRDHYEPLPSSSNYQNIELTAQKSGSRLFCDICGHSTSQSKKYSLQRHMKEQHVQGFSLKCKICTESFTTYYRLSYHIKNVHETGEFKCSKCDRVFNKRPQLQHHMRSHEVVMCPECGKMMNKLQIISHRRSHAEAKCNICGKVLNATQLGQHMKQVHLEDEQTCEFCGSVFGNKTKLRKHIARQHSESKLKCPVAWCSYTSSRKAFVKLHLDHHRDIDQEEKDRLWLEVKKIKGFWT